MFGREHSVWQNYRILQQLQTQTTTTQNTRHFKEYEVALRGWDAEVGARLPLTMIDEYVRFKAFAGYYHYYGRRGLDDVNGFRGRLEAQLKPAFTLEAVYYADDELTGGNYSLGAYVSLPFDLVNLANRRNPFAGALDRWNSGGQSSDMRYRLTDMVKRDPQIRSLLAEPEEQMDLRTTSVRSVSRTDTRQVGDGAVELASDITFVDQDRGNDANPGTYEAPKQTVQGGVDEPRSMVFVFKEGNPFNETIVLTEGVVLRGEGAPIQGFGGRTFGSGVRPTLQGDGNNPVVTMAANTTVQGFNILNPGEGKWKSPPDGIFSPTGDRLIIRDNRIEVMGTGIRVDEPAGDVHVQLHNNFVSDSGTGIDIRGVGNSGSFFVHATGNRVMNNEVAGMQVHASNYDNALVVIDGLQAHNNPIIGLGVNITAEIVSLLSLTDIDAQGADLSGIVGRVTATEGIGAILAGMPQEFMAGLTGLLGGGGMSLEMQALAAAGGGITAINNGTGLQFDVSGRMAGLVTLLDVEASNNASSGAEVDVQSADGLALGLVGSSGNLSEVLQLGGSLLDLLGLGLPALPESSAGYARFNDNGGSGLQLNVQGDFLALGAALGIEANRNQLGLAPVPPAGAIEVNVDSPNIAVGLLGRIQALENEMAGVRTAIAGDGLGLGVLMDIESRSNLGHGIDLEVSGDSVLGLVASTDPLRVLAEELSTDLQVDPPFAIPGVPFGPVLVSGNSGSGINAVLDGQYSTMGAFLNIEAKENDHRGISVDASGETVSLLMAGIEASDNSAQGVKIDAGTDWGAVNLFLADVHAHGNDLQGIRADITSETDVVAFLTDVHASDNLRHGLLLNVDAGGDVLLSLADQDNQPNGVLIDGPFLPGIGGGTVLAGLIPGGPSSFTGNGWDDVAAVPRAGMRADVEATGDITVALLGDAVFSDNSGNGLHLDLENEDGDINVIMENMAAEGNNLNGILVRADNTNEGDIVIFLNTIDALHNTFNGILLAANANDGDISVAVENVTANENTRNGIRVILDNRDNPNDINLAIRDSRAKDNVLADLFVRLRANVLGNITFDDTDNDFDSTNVALEFFP